MAGYDFLALHSPVGACAAFSLGLKNSGGGFTLEDDRVGNQDVFIGYKQGEAIRCFPFFKDATSRLAESFVQKEGEAHKIQLSCFADSEICRDYLYGEDCFTAGPLSFSIACPVHTVPDPERQGDELLKDTIAPALVSRLTVDNRQGEQEMEAFFAVSPMMGKQLLSRKTGGKYYGILSRDGYGFAAKVYGDEAITEIMDFDLQTHYERKKEHTQLTIAGMGGVSIKVPAGKQCIVDIALGWYKGGLATYGTFECTYYYTNFFGSLTDVLLYALQRADTWWDMAEQCNERIEKTELSDAQKFLLVHSVRAYNYSSMFFSQGGRPLWVVNEGTFMMMNTLDLSVDHCFYELKYQPWAVRNQLNLYAEHYSYYDQCGISFTHDCGTHHTFTPEGSSSYEISGIDGCWSYMTQEQLCNWILMAGMYHYHTKDTKWLRGKSSVIRGCLESMINRTDGNEYGIMQIDSSKCEGGAEITTYDSLDKSLGQARDNLYIVMKCFASYLSLETMLESLGRREEATLAHQMAVKCANGVISQYNEKMGYVPAILDGEDTSPIIPVIEPLIYLPWLGKKELLAENAEFGSLKTVLQNHTRNILKKGVCLFEDGGFKLSGNNDNSWMSKIFICSVTAENILGIPVADTCHQAHMNWWRVLCKDNHGVDQIFKGRTPESRFHYPRAVTSVLWCYSDL